ncbi:uncharacterized protein LOC126846503 isoform X28 [Adelges cooleyi]|uniref:uncharacterized protein LOC126846503 isoform X28 n=1 Tax=Adelges cooleyi TaxID=133065 RepID=UPI0021806FA4|nr:uncharacterized protein LOC126846503 isoform X28 [Adelges cooleyi]
MNSNMRLRCVMLFAIYSFGLIILLDAGNASDEKSSELKRVKQSEEAEPLDEEKILLDAGSVSDEKSSELKRVNQSEVAEPLDEEKILLDAGSASDEKSSELKRVKQSEEAEPLNEEKILLDAGSPSDEKSSELKRVNQSEVAEPLDEEKVYEVSDDNGHPLDNLKRRLLKPYLIRCFFFDRNTSRYDTTNLHPLYFEAVVQAAIKIQNRKEDQSREARERLIIATQGMVLGLKNVPAKYIPKNIVHCLWENNKEFINDEKERLLNQIKGTGCYSKSIGHADFRPNGGKTPQPGCFNGFQPMDMFKASKCCVKNFSYRQSVLFYSVSKLYLFIVELSLW